MNQEPENPLEPALAAEATSADSGQPGTAPSAVPASPAPQPRSEHQRGLFGIQAFFTVVIFSIFVITFVAQAFQIPSGSMENTLLVGDFLLVDKLHFAGAASPVRMLPYGSIQRGDIVVFNFPVEPSQFVVKRVIGLPGDRIQLRNKMVYINGVSLQENYAVHMAGSYDSYRDNFPLQRNTTRDVDWHWRSELAQHVSDGELVVPRDEYFVLGDNRENSADSRYWGFVPRTNIVGRPLVIYLSVKTAGPGGSDGKLMHSGPMLAHLTQMARWDRMFRLVR